MAAPLGFKTFATGDVLTAADTNGYLMQGVLVFASAAARDAAITAPEEGQFAYLKDTNGTTYYTGSTWVNLDTTGGSTLIKSQTIGSAVSSVTVTGAFSATYDAYKIIITGGVSSSAAVLLSCQLGATTTGYYWGNSIVTYSSSTPLALNGSNTAFFTRVGIGTTATLNANFDLLNPFLSKNTILNYFYVDSRTNGETGAGGGVLADTTSYTAFTIAPSAGTITGGEIRVYGYNNS
jgi:hypothetical protein